MGSTAAVAVVADVFVGTLNGVIADLGISAAFLGLVIVPLVGNIAENVVGIKIAWLNQMDFSMLVSLGSSLQVALGVAPLLVFVSLLTPHHFDLVFPPVQVLSLVSAAVIVALIVAWLVATARGQSGSPYGWLLAIAGLTYLLAVAWFRWRG